MAPGMHDKNSKPVNEFSKAKFEILLSNADAPAIIVSDLNNDIWENDLPNLIITPSKPPSLISVLEPTPIILISAIPLIFFKKN